METVVLERDGPEPHLGDAIELSAKEAGNLLSALRQIREQDDPLLKEARNLMSALELYSEEGNWAVNGQGDWVWHGDTAPYEPAFEAIKAMRQFVIH